MVLPVDVKTLYGTRYLLFVQVYRLPLHCFAFTAGIGYYMFNMIVHAVL